MENNTKINEEKKEKVLSQSHQILLQNRNSLTMTGITQVNSTNENGLRVKINSTPLEIMGSNIHISRLDVEKGVIELTGNIASIVYDVKNKGNFIKRLFK